MDGVRSILSFVSSLAMPTVLMRYTIQFAKVSHTTCVVTFSTVTIDIVFSPSNLLHMWPTCNTSTLAHK